MAGDRSDPRPAAPATRPARWAVAVAALGLLALAWILVETAARDVPGWERWAFDGVNGLSGRLETPAEGVMLLGTMWVWVPIAVVLGLVTASWRPAAAAALGIVGAWLLSNLVKDVVGRGRPLVLLSGVTVRGEAADGYGFVSGHSAVAFAAATVIAPVLPRRWRVVPFALATLVAVARIYVGVHLPLDVIGGAALGILCGTLALTVTGVMHPVRSPADATRPRP